MKPRPKQDIQKQIEAARASIMEHALIGFVEDIDGKVPDDDTILAEGEHVAFSTTPLTVYKKAEHEFTRYYVWRRKHAVALKFSDKDLITLFIARVPDDEWPGALTAFVNRRRQEKGEGDAT